MSGPASEGLRVGSKFGVYAVGECIGRGAMGQVYRAEHTLLEKTVALKIMASAARNSFTGQHRFVREARAAAAIKHPNVVDILDMGVLDGFPFIVMEFLEGQDLETYLERRGTLTDRQLADLALPIIAALGAVHDAGVVHRDIKPSNIFLAKGTEDDIVPKVLDFGISKALQRDGETFIATGPEDLVGTPLYISPEALRGSQYLTAKSDQYSLGVVLYECATGRRPHEGKDLGKLVNSILHDSVEPLRRLNPSVSGELEAAILRAISRRPEDRFDHVRDLGAALWSLASKRTQHVWAKRFSDLSQSVGAPPTIPVTAPPSERISTPLWARASVALLILVAGLMASIAWFRARSTSGPVAASPVASNPVAASPASASSGAVSAGAVQLALTPKAAPQPATRSPEPEAVPSPSAFMASPPEESQPAPAQPASQQQSERSSPRAPRHAAPARRVAAKSVAAAQRRAVLERGAAPSSSGPPSTPTSTREPSDSTERSRRGANQSPILD